MCFVFVRPWKFNGLLEEQSVPVLPFGSGRTSVQFPRPAGFEARCFVSLTQFRFRLPRWSPKKSGFLALGAAALASECPRTHGQGELCGRNMRKTGQSTKPSSAASNRSSS